MLNEEATFPLYSGELFVGIQSIWWCKLSWNSPWLEESQQQSDSLHGKILTGDLTNAGCFEVLVYHRHSIIWMPVWDYKLIFTHLAKPSWDYFWNSFISGDLITTWTCTREVGSVLSSSWPGTSGYMRTSSHMLDAPWISLLCQIEHLSCLSLER
jgi:hypothetical protein